MSEKKKIVLAYSGGLDTSIILHWLKKEYDADVIAYCADVGQEEELDGLEEKALNTGASKYFVYDLKEEFVKDFVYPIIRGSAVYEMRYLLGTSIARPIIAKQQVALTRQEGAYAISHGATGKGNDQVRFEIAAMALMPEIEIIAPWRTWDFKGREDLVQYAKKENIPISVSPEKPYSMDRNCLHISYEGGILEDPNMEPKENMFLWTKSPEDAPDKPEYIEIDFEKGNAVRLNGQSLTPYGMLKALNELGAKHGVGRVDIVENRLVGIKSRGVYETPGGTILHVAHRDLESITIEKDLQHLKDELSVKYATLVYNGQWFTPEREALQQFIDTSQNTVNGTVKIKLYKGNTIVVGRSSDNSIYSSDLASFEEDKKDIKKIDEYNQFDAEGFIKLFGLTSRKAYSVFKQFS